MQGRMVWVMRVSLVYRPNDNSFPATNDAGVCFEGNSCTVGGKTVGSTDLVSLAV